MTTCRNASRKCPCRKTASSQPIGRARRGIDERRRQTHRLRRIDAKGVLQPPRGRNRRRRRPRRGRRGAGVEPEGFRHPDLEAVEGMPPGVKKLRDLFVESDGYLIAAPEYNGSMPGLLKNALDWVSRPAPGETQTTLRAFRGKVAGIMSASPGPCGGVRGLA